MSTPFPVLQPGDGPKFVRQEALSEYRAMLNHGQMLSRLAERGGLCPVEIFWNLRDTDWGSTPTKVTPEVLEAVRSIAYSEPPSGAEK